MANKTMNVVATAISGSQVNVSWDDVATLTGEVYDVERNGVIVGNDYAGAHTVGSPYQDTGLSPGTAYTYRVRAVGDETPLTIAGLEAWFVFDDITNLWQDAARTNPITTDGQTILGVTDRSGAGQHLSGTVGPTYKTNIQAGKSASLFASASSQVLNSALSASTETLTWFVVVNLPTTLATHTFVGASSSFAFQFRSDIANTLTMNSQGAALIATSSATISDATTTIAACSYTAAGAYRIWVGGGVSTSGTNNLNFTGGLTLKLGAANAAEYMNGYIMECFRYNSALALSDVNVIGNYLATKWGVTWTTAS